MKNIFLIAVTLLMIASSSFGGGQCTHYKVHCNSGPDCCSGICDGKTPYHWSCGCANNKGACGAPNDCCGGQGKMNCTNGICETKACHTTGGTCAVNSDCCQLDTCYQGQCVTPSSTTPDEEKQNKMTKQR